MIKNTPSIHYVHSIYIVVTGIRWYPFILYRTPSGATHSPPPHSQGSLAILSSQTYFVEDLLLPDMFILQCHQLVAKMRVIPARKRNKKNTTTMRGGPLARACIPISQMPRCNTFSNKPGLKSKACLTQVWLDLVPSQDQYPI